MLTLRAKKRELFGGKIISLRKAGVIPAVVYGHGIKTKPVQVSYLDFEKVLHEVGESSLFNLEINKERPVKVLIHDIQYHPVTDRVQHVDFYQIKAGEKITVKVELKFVGISPAVKELGGSLITNLTELEIECLPEDLISELEVDISKLNTFDDIIRVGDLKVSEKVKILQDSQEAIAQVMPPHKEEEVKELEEVTEEKPEEAEKVEEKKEEEGEKVEEEKGKE